MNIVAITGRLTKDPETRSTGNGTSVTSFTVAVDRRFKSASGERQADFISCVAWRQSAEFISKYFKKGSKIEIQGSIQTRTWDDQEGKRHWATEVLVDSAGFGEGKNDGNGNGATTNAAKPAQAATRSNGAPPPSQPAGFDPGLDQDGFQGEEDFDAALPFDLNL